MSGVVWKRFGSFLGPPGGTLGGLEGVFGRLGGASECLGGVLGRHGLVLLMFFVTFLEFLKMTIFHWFL